MRGSRKQLGLLWVGALATFMAAGPLAARVSVGTAYSLEDERVLYLERRTETRSGFSGSVSAGTGIYVCC